ncbi:hypothetical protein COLINT_02054 [Collinsella intestinalis DSM 13280]|uniref:Uncharacterized protein n=1 Tax=Collinsella intestinalis DSM 13280 TaxID=521003 RepID=C4F7N9_9ACTN|nr:hypothetical protein COLINT_02054 [Collinsella intestinalis DSM 13280]
MGRHPRSSHTFISVRPTAPHAAHPRPSLTFTRVFNTFESSV